MYKEGDLLEAMVYLLHDVKKIKLNKVKEYEKKYFRSAASLTKMIDNLSKIMRKMK